MKPRFFPGQWVCFHPHHWDQDGPGLYEPIHGSAPDIAGKGIANPVGTILSAAFLLRYSLRLEEGSTTVEKAVEAVIAKAILTPDLGGKARTEEVTDEILKEFDRQS